MDSENSEKTGRKRKFPTPTETHENGPILPEMRKHIKTIPTPYGSFWRVLAHPGTVLFMGAENAGNKRKMTCRTKSPKKQRSGTA